MSDAAKKSALIIGASRGIGRGLAEEMFHRGWAVTATVRKEADAPQGANTLLLDINDTTQEATFLAALKGAQFDVIFVNSGISAPDGKTAADVTPAEIAHLMMSNAVSPVRLATALVPNIKPGTGVIALMSSILGSVALANGTWPLYSASKAALNVLTKGFAAALPAAANITVITMHPGWVRTDMGGAGADIDVQTSVAGMLSVLDANAGKGGHQYLDYKGKTLPW